jgi:hypothetical protein
MLGTVVMRTRKQMVDLDVLHALPAPSNRQAGIRHVPHATPMQMIHVVTRPQAHATPDTMALL